MSVPAQDVLTIKQLSQSLMVSGRTIYRMLEKKRLPTVRIDAQLRFRKRDMDSSLVEQVRRVDLAGNRGTSGSTLQAHLATKRCCGW